MCPVDDHLTEPITGPDASPGDHDGEPDPLLAAYRLELYWGSDECGGMYRGSALATGTTVSIRVIRPDLSADKGYALAFDQQSERCRQLATHHVAMVLDRGRTADGRLFLVTAYVNGRSLRQFIDDHEPFDWVRVRETTLQLLEGLAEGHRAGVVHWDLKPEAIYFEPGPRGEPPNLRITGFGLPWWPPRGPGGEGGIRPSAYAAPQRFTGGVIEERSDLYALGACLFHLLTGKPPFGGQAASTLASERRAEHRARLSLETNCLPRGIPEGFLHLVQHLMAWSPADRPRDAESATRVLTSLPEAVVDLGAPEGPDLPRSLAPGPSVLDRVARDPRLRWAIAGVLVLAIVGLLSLLLVSPGK